MICHCKKKKKYQVDMSAHAKESATLHRRYGMLTSQFARKGQPFLPAVSPD